MKAQGLSLGFTLGTEKAAHGPVIPACNLLLPEMPGKGKGEQSPKSSWESSQVLEISVMKGMGLRRKGWNDRRILFTPLQSSNQ